MHNLGTVLRFELTRTLKKPTFWIGIFAIPVVFAIVIGIIYFSSTSTDQQQEARENEPFSLVVYDESGLIQPQTLAQLNAQAVSDKQAAIEQVRSGKIDAFFYYPKDLAKESIEVYNKNEGLVDNGKYESVAENLIKSSATAAVGSPDLMAVITDKASVRQTNYENGNEVNPLSRLIAPAIFLVIFYAVIALLGNQMLTSTTEEKENRVTEMLLTSLSPTALIVGKIISLVILGFVQILAILLPVVIAYFTARESLNIPDLASFMSTIQIELWPTLLGAALLVTGFLLFTGLLVAIGAAMPTAKEANSFFGFAIVIMVVPFYFFSMLMTENDSPLVTGLSYFPLTAPFTLLIRNAFGVLPLHEAIIGLSIVAISSVIMISLAIRIFRYGTLEYGNRLSLSSVLSRKAKSAES